jgi:predicted DNA-binding transcriptional regulator YafY
MERLRELGYPVDSTSGVAGGYRLGAGAELPPLLLDNDEAAAVALGLRSLAGGAIAGIEETSLRTLLKLEQVMPPRVRRRVKTLTETIVTTQRAGSPVNVDVLSTLAVACRDCAELRFEYTTEKGASVRKTEPSRVVHDGRRWYLLAWDLDRSDWRTFRVDRLKPRMPFGPRFVPREPPGRDIAAYVSREVERAPWDFRARVKVFTSSAALSARVPASVAVDVVDEHTCIASVGSDSPQMLAVYLGMLGADFEVIDAPELHEPLLTLGKRYLRAARATRSSRRTSSPTRQPRKRS